MKVIPETRHEHLIRYLHFVQLAPLADMYFDISLWAKWFLSKLKIDVELRFAVEAMLAFR
jgi:hypothetical protein